MSLWIGDILTISQVLSQKLEQVFTLDWVFPSPLDFKDKADFWACISQTHDTQREIETDLIRAAWISYLRFEDSDRNVEAPVKTLFFEFTVFHEHSFERLDESLTPDVFNKRILKTDKEHLETIFELQAIFQGTNPLAALEDRFAVIEMISLAQNEFTLRREPCAFIDAGAEGTQTRLECQVKVQLPC